jgi:uncharacterized repeat protein (TIGR03803 family)
MFRSLLFESSSVRGLPCFGLCLVLGLGLAANLQAQTETETILHNFVPEPFGANPVAQLIADASGNLYGTTSSGGLYNNGVVFELMHDANGRWSQKVLYTFSGLSEDYYSSRLLLDSAGNLYGTFAYTETSCGLVYQLSPSPRGNWTYSSIHSFSCSLDSTDGQSPSSGLTMDKAGNLYGVTADGGTYDGGSFEGGTVYELTPGANGTWSEQILYNFGSQDPGGYQPRYELVLDSSGDIFGVTTLGGDNNCNTDLAAKSLTTGCGTAFEFTQSNGAWSENVLYTFPAIGVGTLYWGATSGLTIESSGNLYSAIPNSLYELQPASQGEWTYITLPSPSGSATGPLVADNAGNLYGETYANPSNATIFELKNGSGGWSLSTIYTFSGLSASLNLTNGLAIDAKGELFGTSYNSSNSNDNGAVFELARSAGGTWKEGTIFQFPVVDGSYPNGDLVADSEGNLYGVASAGVINQYGGVVFRLSPLTAGKWKYDVLYNFAQSGAGGAINPFGGVVFDAAGNLYGVAGGGIYGPYGDGTVYKLSPTSSGYWNETTLYSFGSFPTDGTGPVGGLVIDQAGNLYGVTSYGGSQSSCGCYGGTVFELSPEAGATWKEVILHSFQGGRDGALPRSKLIMDRVGSLYGTTFEGGSTNCPYGEGCGTVFELTPGSNGTWNESILHRFTGTDGAYPEAGLVVDASGNLYGTTSNDGPGYYGTVFKLSPNGSGNWTEMPVYSFNGGINGGGPEGDLSFDATGNLYGTTYGNGSAPCIPPSPVDCGTVFRLTPTSGEWTYSTVHRFGSSLGDGVRPQSGVYVDGNGNLFTMTAKGPGSGPGGTVVEIKP